jgi:site-specific recombinase XerD
MNKLNINSVINPTAQTTKLCTENKEVSPVINSLFNICSYDSETPILLKAIIELMINGGLRISEVLKISGKNIDSLGNIHIKASKGSQNRVVCVSLYKNFWLCKKKDMQQIGSIYSRFYFYREFKKLNINFNLSFGQKTAITHYFRKLSANEIYKHESDIKEVQSFLGHNNVNSSKYYINNEKTKEKKSS